MRKLHTKAFKGIPERYLLTILSLGDWSRIFGIFLTMTSGVITKESKPFPEINFSLSCKVMIKSFKITGFTSIFFLTVLSVSKMVYLL